MTLEVFWGSGSPFAWRVLLGLEFKQVPYESKRLSFSPDDLKSPAYLEISPRGKVPAIRNGSYTLTESVAILRYLEDLAPQPALFGNTAEERGAIWSSIMQSINYIDPKIGGFAVAVFFDRLKDNRDEVIEHRKVIESELVKVNESLALRPYLAGDQLSAADIVIYPFIKFLERAVQKENTEAISGNLRSMLLNMNTQYPDMASWCNKIESIPGYDKTYPPHWKEDAK